ncbi:pseudouridine synthase [Kiloniella sp. b19]|uniref:pseudouridine synthase n=1 Tax=Kiloniella sp. GXU_MW_B19 TaxID=3141326 RepID=UPI0031D59B7A
MDILFADDCLVIVRKPSGLLSVPGRAEDNKDSVALRLAEIYPDVLTVHRLDMDTSGLMVFARSKDIHRALSIAFQNKLVNKRYVSLVYGKVEQERGEIDLPLRCDWPNRPLQMVDHDLGKKALTRWQLCAHEERQGEPVSRIDLVPITGRSHQLRVHMKELGYSILGDPFYATGKALELSERLCLHASLLSFVHPVTGEEMTFQDPAPF